VTAVTFVFFDYTCPYSRRMSDLLDSAGVEQVRWRPFALAESNRDDEGAPVWERPEALSRPALLALALHEAVISDGGDVDHFRREVFAAFGQRRVAPEELYAVAEAAGARPDEDAVRAKLLAVAASHEMGRAAGVFGTPTIVTDGGQLGFVKLTGLPADLGARRRLLQVAITAINDCPDLSEIKRPTA
jgi:protein-disulfide isomerase